ncbi:hypothetical protein [Mycoplasmopsis cynos]
MLRRETAAIYMMSKIKN